ncbi:class I SAM-dependent methyltransferase [Acutalibacter sp. 1XD8-33]|uniref:class I SAM-dependent methyltransferase n=1 Tax=Acutalibacter sp. 1XD8-33 TaxID=2320081 RepID=UPI0018F6069A|nr:class I SAM-dependent methyltransferase [Acutalibacter sp. 1XD8-33]
MNKSFEEIWKAEERAARIHGWDFSHLDGRYTEETDLPWDFRALIEEYLRPDHRLLDMDTGGGEFLLSLGHPYGLTSATEGYPPNAALCRETLSPLGVDFREADCLEPLPFEDGRFDVVINRHGDFVPEELFRVLRPGGVFLTQQVGSKNDRELVELLLPGEPPPFPENHLEEQRRRFQRAGFVILRGDGAFRPIRFFDVGALVWFARVIPWEFPGFSVERCLPRLEEAQRLLERDGCVEGTIHRYLIVAQKPPLS